jgi:hypothetical protein
MTSQSNNTKSFLCLDVESLGRIASPTINKSFIIDENEELFFNALWNVLRALGPLTTLTTFQALCSFLFHLNFTFQIQRLKLCNSSIQKIIIALHSQPITLEKNGENLYLILLCILCTNIIQTRVVILGVRRQSNVPNGPSGQTDMSITSFTSWTY